MRLVNHTFSKGKHSITNKETRRCIEGKFKFFEKSIKSFLVNQFSTLEAEVIYLGLGMVLVTTAQLNMAIKISLREFFRLSREKANECGKQLFYASRVGASVIR